MTHIFHFIISNLILSFFSLVILLAGCLVQHFASCSQNTKKRQMSLGNCTNPFWGLKVGVHINIRKDLRSFKLKEKMWSLLNVLKNLKIKNLFVEGKTFSWHSWFFFSGHQFGKCWSISSSSLLEIRCFVAYICNSLFFSSYFSPLF